MKITVAHRSLPALGEDKNGDRAVYRSGEGAHLLAVIDGLGHGPKADAASSAASEYLSGVDLHAPLLETMQGTHRALSGSRGAAGTICIVKGSTVEACAVGNVEMRSGALRIPLVASPGVLGTRVAKFRVCQAQVEREARLILFSDGISSRIRFDEHQDLAPDQLCERVLEEHRRDYDDSTILVADLEFQA